VKRTALTFSAPGCLKKFEGTVFSPTTCSSTGRVSIYSCQLGPRPPAAASEQISSQGANQSSQVIHHHEKASIATTNGMSRQCSSSQYFSWSFENSGLPKANRQLIALVFSSSPSSSQDALPRLPSTPEWIDLRSSRSTATVSPSRDTRKSGFWVRSINLES